MPRRPLPGADAQLWGPYLDGLAAGRLRVQRCTSCGTPQWPPREICHVCRQGSFDWIDGSGTGTVYTYTVVNRAFDPYFETRVPYGIVVADLDEPAGIRVLAPYFDRPVTELHCGMRVTLSFEPAGGSISLPRWGRLDGERRET